MKIKNNAVTGAKIANNSVTGADVREGSLGKVPSASKADTATHATSADSATNATNATNATTLAGASLDSLTIGRSTAVSTGGGTSSSCDPTAATFVDCGTVSLTLPRPGRVLLIANLAFDGQGGSQAYRGDCELTVDAARVGSLVTAGSVSVVQAGDTDFIGPGFNANTPAGTGLNAVSDVLAAGTHDFSLQCKEAGGTVEFPETYLSAVMIGAG